LAQSVTVTLDEGQRQAVLLALAWLALDRPGWDHMLGEIAQKMDNPGAPMYQGFKESNMDRAHPLAFPCRASL